jgi:glycosyltransferase involved in cell wall biosynthesis
MRLCFVSSYPPTRCGIASYTTLLAQAVATNELPGERRVFVLSEHGALDGEDGAVLSIPCFGRSDDYALGVAARVSAARADVVHVQHSSDIFGFDGRLPRLLTLLRARGIRTVVTFHSVHSRLTAALERKRGVPEFHRRIGELADTLVVHGAKGMHDVLLRQGIPGHKVAVIPHGTELVSSPSRAEARALLGLREDGPLLLYFGFVHPQKSVHTALLAMRHLTELAPAARICIAGSVQNRTRVNQAYAASLRWLSARPSLASRVVMRDGYSSAEATRALFRAADVVLLPYREGYGSASGVAHQAIGAGRLLLCSASPKFAELASAIGRDIVVEHATPSAWANAIVRLLRDERLRDELTRRVERYARATSWARVAARHVALYRRLSHSALHPATLA